MLMSWLPLFNSWVVFLGIISIFFWKLGGVFLFIIFSVVSVYCLISEVFSSENHYLSAFLLFILSEIIIFVTLFVVTLWNSDMGISAISEWVELPLLGCFLLIGSSISATAYHHMMGLEGSRSLLVMTMVLGVSFIFLQIWEFYDCECDILHSVYHAGSFCTVGLHFSHVLVGVLGLAVLYSLGLEIIGVYYVNLIVWYWHFVDYIWLFVFLLIYVV